MDLEQPFQKQQTDSEVGNQGQIYLNEVYLNSTTDAGTVWF